MSGVKSGAASDDAARLARLLKEGSLQPGAMIDDILDDLFHGCALQAWLEQAALEGRMPCESATRRRAFQFYEEALRMKQPAAQSNAAEEERPKK